MTNMTSRSTRSKRICDISKMMNVYIYIWVWTLEYLYVNVAYMDMYKDVHI